MGLISVIVPIYKVEPYLDKCIASIVQQTYSNLEIILVDDGSPDSCPAICDRWAEKDARIRVIHKENGGVSSTRNAGLRIAQGQFISFVDSDDYINSQMLEMMIAEMGDEKVGIVECGSQEIFTDHIQNIVFPNAHMPSDVVVKELLGSTGAPVWNKLFRRAVLENVEFYEELRYGEDTLFFYQALKRTGEFVQIPFVGYYHLMRDDSLVGNHFKPYQVQSLWAAEKVAKEIQTDYPQLLEQAHCHVIRNALVQLAGLLKTEKGSKTFPDEYAICIQTLRSGDPAILKKHLSAKHYTQYQFFCKAPTLYPFAYCTWQKVKRKYHG